MANLFGRPRIPQSGNLIVDQTHALARGLHDCVVFNIQGQHGLVNLAAQQLNVAFSVLSIGGTGQLPTWGATPDGVALTTVAGGVNVGGGIDIANQGPVTAGDCAWRVRFIINASVNGAFGTIMEKNAGSGVELGLYINDTTGVINQINLGAQVSSPGGNAVSLHVVQDILLTKTAGVGTLYQNGVATVTGLSLTGTTNANTFVRLGNDRGFGGSAVSASYLQFQTWTRNITAAEALQLYLDPYCFLTSLPLQQSLMFFFPPPPPLPLMGQIWI